MDERALVKKLNRGSRGALDAAVERFTPYVSTVILHTLAGRACREDVEELCADVFVALWTNAPGLDPEQGLRPWLAAVARNKATDWLRRARPSSPIPDSAQDPSPARRSWPSSGSSPPASGRRWTPWANLTAPCSCATTTRGTS